MINTLASVLEALPAQAPGTQDSVAQAAQQAAAQAAGNPTVTMLVVLAGTAVVMFLIRAIGMMSEKHHPDKVKTPRAPKAAASTPAASQAASAQASADEESRLAAVIAAAVAAVIQQPHAIRGFAAVTESQLQSWASEGRRAIYASHKIR